LAYAGNGKDLIAKLVERWEPLSSGPVLPEQAAAGERGWFELCRQRRGRRMGGTQWCLRQPGGGSGLTLARCTRSRV